ncbi:MAG: hypothetical protein WCV79_00580 [Candidatus Paceibacterota bacterium]
MKTISFLVLSVVLMAGIVSAATTISSNISTGGNLTVSGTTGIGTTSPWALLSVNPNAITGPSFAVGSSTGTHFVITQNGVIGIGTANPLSTAITNTATMKLDVEYDQSNSEIQIISYKTTASSAGIRLKKARGNQAVPEVVADGDLIGSISSQGYSGAFAGYRSLGSIDFNIDGEVDTAGDTSDMPGRIIFYTTPDGSASIAERMRITSGGNVGIGTTSPTSQFQVATPTANATTSVTFGKSSQNKGTCLELFDSVGTAQYISVQNGALVVSATSCK